MTQLIRSLGKALVIGLIGIFSLQTASAQDGKALFAANCASCHKVDKDLTGPALMGLEGRGPWGDKQKLYAWIHNPAGFMATDPYTQNLKSKYGVVMQAFPSLSTKEIDAIVAYINNWKPPVAAAPGAPVGGNTGSEGDNSLMFGILTIILGIIALILLQVNSNLRKLSDEKEGIRSPEPVPFWKNKVYLLVASLVLFVLGGYFLARAAIGLGRQKDYQPEQPIYYSHKVHAGTNQISCLYCHGGAQQGKHANIPSINICMNCHMAINEYNGTDKLYREDGTEVNGTAEIQKLYKYAGFDPNATPKVWDASKASKPIEWVRIHNLPDHVYFNHAQHVVAGKQQCQTCHGPIQAMGEVKQFADLSMGWCINCHRETKVQFNDDKGNGNKYYSIYEKFHEDIKNKKYDSVTVEMIGGTECQKCHY